MELKINKTIPITLIWDGDEYASYSARHDFWTDDDTVVYFDVNVSTTCRRIDGNYYVPTAFECKDDIYIGNIQVEILGEAVVLSPADLEKLEIELIEAIEIE